MNNVVLIGRLTRDSELRYIAVTVKPVANFTLAINRNLSKEKGGKSMIVYYPEKHRVRELPFDEAAELLDVKKGTLYSKLSKKSNYLRKMKVYVFRDIDKKHF